MSKILILYHSSHGSVTNMAHEFADTIVAQGGEAMIRVFEKRQDHDVVVTKQDLISCDGLAFGTPTRFGMMAAQAKAFLGNHQRLMA